MSERAGVDPTVPPSGTGCVECEAAGGWWVHLRRCTQCGHIGCCDTSPAQHATAHFRATGHPVITSFEPGEDWFWDFTTESGFLGPQMCPATEHPAGPDGPRSRRPGARGLARPHPRVGAQARVCVISRRLPSTTTRASAPVTSGSIGWT